METPAAGKDPVGFADRFYSLVAQGWNHESSLLKKHSFGRKMEDEFIPHHRFSFRVEPRGSSNLFSFKT
ncbi:Hypothetical protein Minf_1435 [Methylacidiphilum infernorum V4]|uniref:Uncharacterized protein n=1 Tax=Methylacidiphilum infernorum (isolate V4) TaxID=481448 RepID=B3DVY6_METI4|nr:Hypothetical protein Minf_1435 [Methylacidiphilum infernorum V4]